MRAARDYYFGVMVRLALGMTTTSVAAMTTAGCAASQEESEQTEDELRGSQVTPQMIDDARRSGDAVRIASLLHSVAADRSIFTRDSTRIERMKQLFDGMSVDQVRAVRAAYITANDADPEITIRSDGLGHTFIRLDRNTETEMIDALTAPQMAADARVLAEMLQRAERSENLTTDDRKTYFALLPMMGLWDAPVRAAAGNRSLDAIERTLLDRAWKKTQAGAAALIGLDEALTRIEAKLPATVTALDTSSRAPGSQRSKSIAVIASSHGAQWQELMGWAVVMHQRAYHLQLFTPAGRPVALQRDSISVSSKTARLGFGCPRDLDPAGATGELARSLFANTASAASFNARDYGAVYLVGGLGFNDDVAVARPAPTGRSTTTLSAAPAIAAFMQSAIAERLPIIAVCHAPTLLAATSVVVAGRTEALNAGIETASLPPFESFAGLTGRKELQFTYDVNTHGVLAAAGGRTSVVSDIANMSRVVSARKAGLEIEVITGPGPQAAGPLAPPTIDAMNRRWAAE